MTPDNLLNTNDTMPMRRSDDVDLHVARRVKERRNQLKMTQQDIAKKLGISYQQVQKYESGFNRISAGKLFALAQLLDVSVNHFYIGADEAGLAETNAKALSSISQVSNQTVKKALKDLIDAIAQSNPNLERLDSV